MRRLLLVLSLVIFAGQTTALASALGDDCLEVCASDEAAGDCPPSCPTDTCCAHAHMSALWERGAASVADIARIVPVDAVTPFLPCPEPREIHHVPKRHVPEPLPA